MELKNYKINSKIKLYLSKNYLYYGFIRVENKIMQTSQPYHNLQRTRPANITHDT